MMLSCRSAAEGGTHGGNASQAWEVPPCREESNLPGAKSLCKEKVSRLVPWIFDPYPSDHFLASNVK